MSFDVAFERPLRRLPGSQAVRVVAAHDGGEVDIPLWKPLAVTLDAAQLTEAERGTLAALAFDPLASFVLDVEHARNRRRVHATGRRPLAVVTYANGDGGWFPYFYGHYSAVAGERSIYVVTPRPDDFASYALGGVIGFPHMAYDDGAKAMMVEKVAGGLLAMFTWTLAVDVDEIVIPHPSQGKTLIDLLADQGDDVVLSRGLDILQVGGEADFDFQQPVLNQRRYGVPNTALCKPHLARVPLRYSGGQHYCDHKLDFAAPGRGILTLHLKWACRRIRREVEGLVAKTPYTDERIARYSADSVSTERGHPAEAMPAARAIVPLESDVMARFEEEYRQNLRFEAARWLWVGKHLSAAFTVDLRDLG